MIDDSGKPTLAVIAEQAVVKARSPTGRLREYILREVVYCDSLEDERQI